MRIGVSDALGADFVWARNKIAHERGKATLGEATVDGSLRDVPMSGIERYEDKPPTTFQIEIDRPYIEKAGSQLFAFFHRAIDDLKARYE